MLYQTTLDKKLKEWTEDNLNFKYGSGIVWYFRFLKFLIVYNFCLFILQWITLIPHFIHYFQSNRRIILESVVTNINNNLTNIEQHQTMVEIYWIDSITLSSYVEEDFNSWYIFSAFSIIAVFSMSIIYQYCIIYKKPIEDPYLGRYNIQHHHQAAINVKNNISTFTAKNTIENLSLTNELNQIIYTRWEKILYNFTSFILFIGLVVIFSVIIYYVQALSNQWNSTTLTSLILSLVYISVKAICCALCQLLSKIEKHDFDTNQHIWEGARLFGFKLFCYFAFYFLRDIGLTQQDNENNQINDACSTQSIGVQHLLLSMNYIYSDFVAAIFFAWLVNKYNEWKNIRIVKTNQQLLTEFRLSEQYSQILFRQALLCGGLSFILGSPLSACLGHLIQYYGDKYRLNNLTQVKIRNESNYINMIHCYNFILGLVLLLGYPKGFLWLWIDSNSFFTCDSFKNNIT